MVQLVSKKQREYRERDGVTRITLDRYVLPPKLRNGDLEEMQIAVFLANYRYYVCCVLPQRQLPAQLQPA